jgi:hypothetical protein
MSADQLALMSTRQGRTQAQLELLQQQMQKQQVGQVFVAARWSVEKSEAGLHAAVTPDVGDECAAFAGMSGLCVTCAPAWAQHAI